MLTPASSIVFIGFGDVARHMAAPLARRGMTLRAYDPHYQPEHIEATGVDPAGTIADALRGAKLVVAAVSADSSRELAQSVAPLLTAGQIWLDLSDAPTAMQQQNAALIECRGAHYVAGHAGAALLLAGTRASVLATALDALGLPACAVADLPQCCVPERDAAAMPSMQSSALSIATPLRRGELP